MILAWLSVAFVAGVLLGSWGLPVLAAAALLAASALLLGALRRRIKFWPVAAAIACVFLGVMRFPHPGQATAHDLRYYNGRFVQVQGIVSQEPDIRDTGANYVVSAATVTIRGRVLPVSGLLQVHTARSETLAYGDSVFLEARLATPTNGSIPYATILANRGIFSEMRFPRFHDLGPAPAGPDAILVRLRERIEAGINRWLPEPEAALLIAITLGAKSASLGDLAPLLIATGLIHVIAISGIKVAMVAGTVYELSRTLRRPTVTLLISLTCLTGYVLLTGATASGMRSGVMWALVFIAAYLGRGTVAQVSLGFVAAVMVAVDPSLLFDIGFQLSVVGTLAIVIFADPLLRAFRWIPSPAREAFCVSIAAQIGTLPIVIAGFHLLSLTGPLANTLVLPLLPFLIAAGFVIGLLSGVTPLAAALGGFTYALLHAVILAASALASVGHALPLSIPMNVTLLYYALLIAVAYWVIRRLSLVRPAGWSHRSREISVTMIAGLAFGFPLIHVAPAPEASIHRLGTGESMLVQAGPRALLIDGSPRPFRLLERLGQLLPYQQRAIDAVMVTDPRAGNVVGLQAVLQHYRVNEVLDVGVEYPNATYASWRAELRTQGIPVYSLRTGTTIRLPGVTVTAIGPDGLYSLPQDSIAMLRLRSGRRTVLLASAASQREQDEAVFRQVHVAAGTLVWDGKGPMSAAFVHAVDPVSGLGPVRFRASLFSRLTSRLTSIPFDPIKVKQP